MRRSHVTQKINTVAGVLADPHFLVLSLATFGLLIASLYAHRRVPFVVAIALALGVTNVIPTPSYQQYFVTLVPFLVVATVDLLVLVTGRNPSSSKVAGIALLAIVLGALVPLAKAPALASYPCRVGPRRPTDSTCVPPEPSPPPSTRVRGLARPFSPSGQASCTSPTRDRCQVWRATGKSRRYESPASHQSARTSTTCCPPMRSSMPSNRTRRVSSCWAPEPSAMTDPGARSLSTAGYRPVERLGLVTLYEYGATGESGG